MRVRFNPRHANKSFKHVRTVPVHKILLTAFQRYVVWGCTQPKVIHSWSSTVISRPRLCSPAQPDQKQPIHGVLLPDFGMNDESTTIALRPPLRYSLMVASLKDKQSKLSFSKMFRYVCSLKEIDAVRYGHEQFYSIHEYFLKRFVFLYSN